MGDDLEEQRDLGKVRLERLGYRVETAAGGEQDLAWLAGQSVDLLLLDMIRAPGIDGLETYQRALALKPKQWAILVSGYAETDRVQQTRIDTTPSTADLACRKDFVGVVSTLCSRSPA